MRKVLVIADDLSGSAEVAAALSLRTKRSLVLLYAESEPYEPVVVVDVDTRSGDASTAEAKTAQAVAALGADRQVFLKIDSQLRGHVAAAVDGVGGFAVVCPALPRLGRTMRDGVVHVDGVPLHKTQAWRVEPVAPPHSVADLLAPRSCDVVDLSCVRSSRNELVARLREIRASGAIAVCDAETDADLEAVAQAGTEVGAVLVGSAALLARGAEVAATVPARDIGVLVVVGTAAATAQVEHLRASGARVVSLLPSEILARPQVAVDGDVVVLAVDPSEGIAPSAARDLVAAFADIAADAARSTNADLLLTGGETARAVLDRLGVTRLDVHGSIPAVYGAVVSTTPDGRRVVTKPGSFGDMSSLTDIAICLGGKHVSTTSSHDTRPFIALTMGDGAGIGPEVIVGALLDGAVAEYCRPVVVGDLARLRLAAEVLGAQADIVTVETVADAVFTPGRINVIDLALLPADLQWGEVSPVAGDAAYHYVRVASELAMSGQVQGICTAPLNKEALHAGGHIYPGHTELLAALTGTEEVSMMLSTPKVKVIHVTTHIGLVDAVRRIEPGLVERTVRRGHAAMVRAGIANPKIGVCAINPHAGENGLFGQGEEEEKIVPAITVLQADGIDARGPLPADTAFFLAGRGDYDLIVAMYHDQGHGPVKVLGIEAGVNITVGLPVIRTSVDHGTAFDIAGKGVADARSMVEALRQAAQLSPSPGEVRG
ncbi:4-hydroxythreonine-4-phosphate dehydrogenase [Kibdelosporangium banguiense]|uniref:4-hydroxythreonine-4-phosphate dehydrogenase n=1 Tax=Kibdelosporangium banguiense TaxID=1365924 RepID=A0ABS4U0I3_9PSEU|nr:4-hydroxythreonine-4-phosphate dehydrogenase PdxA [Kibdelosporangium banguiense]MBP2329753.1 4-hydroxythreonine-4-phosphate dehydrogenase [Kibdelosporangium banguiense]